MDQVRRENPHPLSVWQRIQIARHPQRPYTLDYVKLITEEFYELHGDRRFGDDLAIVCGFARMGRHPIMLIGHQKGRDTKERQVRCFGCAHPEGYRKALRLMKLAEKLMIPCVTFIDTPGAYPGVGAEERGQAEAIAVNIMEMSRLKVPIVAVIIGEGGSGGALGIGVADRVLIMENAYYSVISPEGCASILWRDKEKHQEAAAALKITAPDLYEHGIVDDVIPEPEGGAHHDYEEAARSLRIAVKDSIERLIDVPTDELLKKRYERYRAFGVFTEEEINGEDKNAE